MPSDKIITPLRPDRAYTFLVQIEYAKSAWLYPKDPEDKVLASWDLDYLKIVLGEIMDVALALQSKGWTCYNRHECGIDIEKTELWPAIWLDLTSVSEAPFDELVTPNLMVLLGGTAHHCSMYERHLYVEGLTRLELERLERETK